jgi:predicted ArsR family transcriptional regulator
VNEAERLRHPGPERTLAVARDVLSRHGFEPVPRGEHEVVLRNCPFHVLARRAPDLVCGMNQAFVDGLLRGMGNDSVEAALTCVPGECCVTLVAPSRGA